MSLPSDVADSLAEFLLDKCYVETGHGCVQVRNVEVRPVADDFLIVLDTGERFRVTVTEET